MTPRLKTARYLDHYRIELTFADGKCGVLDMQDELRCRIFGPLQDVAVFKSFRFDGELATIVGPNGADLAPEFLYERATSSSDG